MKFHLCILSFLVISCEGVDYVNITPEKEEIESCNTSVIALEKYYKKDNEEYLWGGEDTSTHFNITDWTLNECNLAQGLGREKFHALILPEYELLTETSTNYPDTSRAVILAFGNNVKVYPFQLLRLYETINETVDENPVIVVYCFLADLATVYTREYCGETLTFGVSGYTYKDPNAYDGKESFILWDRNSESLWWPINDKGVSGVFKDFDLIKYNFSKWGVATFKEIKNRYPNAIVLKGSQVLGDIGIIDKTEGC